ncbi:MAG: SOS response-associated peptidase family protein [Clostridia bacterium]|nr:SOS response-associated peptidase family protein [Clostridia bacterium]
MNDRRCLIPASCYFEWHKTDKNKKDKYAFYAENREPLYLAGLYIKTSDQQRLPCFSILSQDAASNIREIHPRMPVIVPYSRAEEWLSPDTDISSIIPDLQTSVVPILA